MWGGGMCVFRGGERGQPPPQISWGKCPCLSKSQNYVWYFVVQNVVIFVVSCNSVISRSVIIAHNRPNIYHYPGTFRWINCIIWKLNLYCNHHNFINKPCLIFTLKNLNHTKEEELLIIWDRGGFVLQLQCVPRKEFGSAVVTL